MEASYRRHVMQSLPITSSGVGGTTTIMSRESILAGLYGFQMNDIPTGHIVNTDSDMCLKIYKEEENLRWSLKFFENLHMDLSLETREHLHQEIDRIGRTIFRDKSGWNVIPDHPTITTTTSASNQMEVDGNNNNSNEWSPIIDLEYKTVPTRNGQTATTTTPPATALIITHQVERSPGQMAVMGRFLLPVRRGLFEVIAIAEPPCRQQSPALILPNEEEHHYNNMMDVDELEQWQEQQHENAMIQDDALNYCDSYNNEHTNIIHASSSNDTTTTATTLSTLTDRVRTAMSWLCSSSSSQSGLVVTEPLTELHVAGSEVELRQLRCKLVVPSRFLYSPNTSNPESNKHRFCRASFGGSDGVQAMVLSCWYGRHIPKGIQGLRQVALHGAKVIHESQQLTNICITTKEIRVKNHNSKKWLTVKKKNRDAIVTIVNCQESCGIPKQNTIGWIREANSGIIFLVYFIDTLELNPETVQTEILDTLASIRVPRLHPSQYAWTIQSMILRKSAVPSQGLLPSSFGQTTTAAATTSRSRSRRA